MRMERNGVGETLTSWPDSTAGNVLHGTDCTSAFDSPWISGMDATDLEVSQALMVEPKQYFAGVQ